MPDSDPTRLHSPNTPTAKPEPTGSLADPAATTGGEAPAFGFPIPSSAARYKLDEEIAHGGMGIIYRSTDTILGREVAIKVLQEKYGSASAAARRFADEAHITAQLQHPAIPPVHDLGALPDGRPFLAMKLIKGQTLEDLLAERESPNHERGRFIAIFEQVCQALAYAHDRKVIHRDLKPANIMVGSFGDVQVMDWGLAKVLGTRTGGIEVDPDETRGGTEIRSTRDTDGPETQAGSVLGTPAYMPPEQAVGAIGKIDARSDVFGLGAILAVILTGQPPYAGSARETTRVLAARGKVDECFVRLDASGSDPELIALCKRCLAPEKENRPADAGEVASAVAEIRAAADERARRAEWDRVRAEGETREQRKRRRVQAILALTLVIAVAGLGFGMWREEKRTAEREREKNERTIEKTERERERADQEREKLDREREKDAAAEKTRAVARQQLENALDRAFTAFRADHLPEGDIALDRAADFLAHAQTAEFQARYDELRSDRAFAVELDRVWSKANALVDYRIPGPGRRTGGFRFDIEAARKGYPASFTTWGLDVRKAKPEEISARIVKSAMKDRIVTALDDWLPVSAVSDRAHLYTLLERIDTEPSRNEIRKAYVELERLPTLFNRIPSDSALRIAARAASSTEIPTAKGLPVLQAAANRHPDDFRIQYATGLKMLPVDQASAAGYFRSSVSLRPDNIAAVFGLGVALHNSGKPGEAVSHYLRAIQLDPGFASAHLNLADAIKIGADPAPAIAFFEREVANKPKDAMAYFGLGMALRDNNSQRAATAFRKSIALDDTFAMAHNYLGYVLPINQIEEGIRCFRRASELDPTFAFPHYNLAGRLRMKRDFTGAIAEYHKALQLFPEHTFSHRDLGTLLLLEKRDPKAAAEHFKRVIEINPNFNEVYPLLGQCLLEAEDFAGAVEIYRAAIFSASSRSRPGIPRWSAFGNRISAINAVVAYACSGSNSPLLSCSNNSSAASRSSGSHSLSAQMIDEANLNA